MITDLDEAIVDTTRVASDSPSVAAYKTKCKGSEKSGAERQTILNDFVDGNPWLSVHYANNTFEVDFLAAGNSSQLVRVLPEVYIDTPTITASAIELESDDKALYGKRVLTMATNEGKGWFAVLLADKIDSGTVMPMYIIDAIRFLKPVMSVELLCRIYAHRINSNELENDDARVGSESIGQYRNGDIEIDQLNSSMMALLPDDQVHRLLADES